MSNLKIYVCGHNNLLNLVPNYNYLHKLYLNKLDIGKYQSNQLAESRAFLCKEINEPVEYIGFLSQRYRYKWPNLASWQGLAKLGYNEKTIFFAELAPVDWSKWFNIHCVGMKPIFEDMVDYAGLDQGRWPTIINNCFICHWDIFQKFITKWKDVFNYIYNKYPPETMKFETYDNSRRAGCLYESLSSLIFSDMIFNLKLDIKFMKLENTKKLKTVLI